MDEEIKKENWKRRMTKGVIGKQKARTAAAYG